MVLVLIGAALPLIPAPALAASTLNFPRLSFETGTFTGVAIVNPNGESAAVVLTAFAADGSLLSGPGFQNPASINVPANQQISKLLPEIFGAALQTSTVGWVQAASAADGLTGFFLYLDGADTFLDGADLPVPSIRLAFNQLRIDNGFRTELNLVNPGSAAASLSLQISGSGILPGSRTATIPARGTLRLDVAAFFAVSALPDGAFLTVSADNPVAGFQLIRSPQGEILGLNGRDTAEQMSTLFFPQMAVLGAWSTEVGLVNHSATAAILTITAFQPDGSLYGPPVLKNNPVTRALPPGASLREDVTAMFGFNGSTAIDGWLRVESTAPALNGYLSYGAGKRLASVTTASAGLGRTLFSHIGTALGFFTGVAVLNPGSLAVNLRIMAMRSSGTALGIFDTVLQPGQRLSSLIQQLIPQAQGQAGGLIWIKSDRPVYSTELFGTANTLANVPGQPAPESYNPDLAVPSLRVTPPLIPVQINATQVFVAEGNGGPPTWKVNGLAGGDPAFGTISSTGSYRAPASVPSPQAITITAESGSQVGGATVDVLNRLILVSGLGVVQSVAFLNASARLFDAEVTLLGSPKLAQTATSSVFEVSPAGVRTGVATYEGELTAKMIPFTAQGGKEHLLLAGQTTGRIIRLDPATRQSVDVATGLNQPSSLVLDPVSGNLLVAEADRVSIILRSSIEPASAKAQVPSAAAATFVNSGADGIAVDACTGLVYVSRAARGEILAYNRILGTACTVASGLRTPRAMLAIYRTGVSCPATLQLLVIEAGLDRIVLFDPATGSVVPWIGSQAPSDLSFMRRASPFGEEERVLMSEAEGQNGSRIASIRIPGLYGAQPPNSPYPILGYSPSVTLTVSPAEITLSPGGRQQFEARISGVANTAVLFATTGGTISETGLLTASQTPGTYTVTVTSVAYPKVIAEATVRVQ